MYSVIGISSLVRNYLGVCVARYDRPINRPMPICEIQPCTLIRFWGGVPSLTTAVKYSVQSIFVGESWNLGNILGVFSYHVLYVSRVQHRVGENTRVGVFSYTRSESCSGTPECETLSTRVVNMMVHPGFLHLSFACMDFRGLLLHTAVKPQQLVPFASYGRHIIQQRSVLSRV